jgi:hypothetical protein
MKRKCCADVKPADLEDVWVLNKESLDKPLAPDAPVRHTSRLGKGLSSSSGS